MSQAYLIIEDDPGRRLFLEKKLQGATAPWLLCDSSVAVNTLVASAADCVVIDVARPRVPFFPLWKELKTASGDHLKLVFTGTRGSEIATREETWDESVTSCEILNFASLRRRLGLGEEPARQRRRGIPRWKRKGLSVLETGIRAETKEIARADWIRYAAQYIHYEGEEAYFRAFLQKLHRDLSWLKTVYPPEGVPASPAETLNPLGTGAGPFPAR